MTKPPKAARDFMSAYEETGAGYTAIYYKTIKRKSQRTARRAYGDRNACRADRW